MAKLIKDIQERLADGHKLLYLTKYGSSLYGTNLPTSDEDYKGIFLPEPTGLILQKSPKTFNFSSGNDTRKNTSEDVDAELYSLQYFFHLLLKSDTNMVSILFSRSNPDTIVYQDKWFKEVFDEVDTHRLISRNLSGMAGYVKSQVYKYSLKGFKYTLLMDVIANFETLQQNQLLEDVFIPEGYVAQLEDQFPNKNVRKYVDIVTLPNPDGTVSWYLEVLGKKLNFREKISRHMKVLLSLEKSFGHRAKQSAQEEFADRKAVYHAFRVLEEIRELHTTGNLVYPISNKEFLLQVRQGDYSMNYLADLLQERLEEVEALEERSVLRKSVDSRYMDDIIVQFYQDILK